MPETRASLSELLGTAESDLDTVLDRFAALLRISEIEAGARRAAFAPTNLAALLADAVALYEPLAEENSLNLALDAGAAPPILCDRNLLFETVSNPGTIFLWECLSGGPS